MNARRIICISCLMILIAHPALAQNLSQFFPKTASYNVYLSMGEDDLHIIYDVEIIRVVEIADQDFLVIKPREFTLKDSEGYVLFNSVRAILPNQKLKLQKTDRIKFH